jgi:alpha-L-fucosidase
MKNLVKSAMPSWMTSGFQRSGWYIWILQSQYYEEMLEALKDDQRETYKQIAEMMEGATDEHREQFKLILMDVLRNILRKQVDKAIEMLERKIINSPDYQQFLGRSNHGNRTL